MLTIARQSLELQQKTTEVVLSQAERTEKLQQRAEALQSRSETMVSAGKKIMLLVVPVLIALIIYVSWLLFGKLGL